MRRFNYTLYAFAALAVLLPGCDSHGSTPSGFGPAGVNAAPSNVQIFDGVTNMTAAVRAIAPDPDQRKSWISPDIKHSSSLLFVSDAGHFEVFILSIPNLKLKGIITGFPHPPQGECSDKQGNIWVTTDAPDIVKLSHTGDILTKLGDPAIPVGCAVDPTTGNLAVTNIITVKNGLPYPGDVLVYAGASGSPAEYKGPPRTYYYFAGYDGSGNLYADGLNDLGNSVLTELPKGATKMHAITLSGGTVYFPGMVQWYTPGKVLAVGDQLCGYTDNSCIYWVSISGTKGTIKATTNLLNYLGGPACDLVQGVLSPYGQKDVVGSVGACANAYESTDIWAYPAGGTPKEYNLPPLSSPIGAAISISK
jgi:hypothetical protein